jgi:hypothetical protein
MVDGQVHEYHRRVSTKVAEVTIGLAILDLTFLADSFGPLLQRDSSFTFDSTTASESSRASAVSYPLLQPENSLTAQLVFPYSVIPGDARNSRELLEAARREPVVAAHPAEFSLVRARVIRLRHDKLATSSTAWPITSSWTKKEGHLASRRNSFE